MPKLDKHPLQRELGRQLHNQRLKRNLSQSQVAASAGISASYYCGIEKSKCDPPPFKTLMRILDALEFDDAERGRVGRMAAIERGVSPDDSALSEEIQGLIGDIRKHAEKMPARFVRGLRAKIREAIT